MPALSDAHVQELLIQARDPDTYRPGPPGIWVAKDYCRSCDEFYWTGSAEEARHWGHRLTIVPCVEDRTKW